tara:strand:+ start:1351 stop:1704 length:354 start_codon:yes stop_codon:yes gene_type:complete
MGLDYVNTFLKQRWHQKTYIYILYFSYILFGLAFTGIVTVNPLYLTTLETILKYYICIFLIVRFNPWFNPKPRSEKERFDRRISYSAGVFLLLTTAVTKIAEGYFIKLHKTIRGYLS